MYSMCNYVIEWTNSTGYICKLDGNDQGLWYAVYIVSILVFTVTGTHMHEVVDSVLYIIVSCKINFQHTTVLTNLYSNKKEQSAW